MARETKVGLLAGLAFIICFAVILANRGANPPPGAASAFLPNGGLELPKLMQRQQTSTPESTVNPNRVARKPGSNTPPVQPGSRSPQEPAGRVNPRLVTTEIVPATGAQLPLETRPQLQAPNADSAFALNTRPVDQPQNPATGLERALTSPSPNPSLSGTNAPVSMTATPPTNNQPGMIPVRTPPNEPVAQPASTSVIEGTPYTVKPSDTLSSIAAVHYGTKSKKAVEAIYEANRDLLPNMNNLKVGTVLSIPKLASAATDKARTSEKQPEAKVALAADKVAETKTKENDKATAKKDVADKKPSKKPEQVADADKSDRNFKWYQVKKNDRFASIARDQLGDAGRWHEVYEMNKDKFPDPQHIREGVRIKLPMGDSLASAAKGKEKTR